MNDWREEAVQIGYNSAMQVINAYEDDIQKNPDKYKNLQVRVCGWNVLWNNLSRAEQDAYILRAENIQY